MLSETQFGRIISLYNLFPVHNLPDLIEESESCVFVVEVVRVLPNVNVQERHVIRTHIADHILVFCLNILKLAGAFVVG